MEQENNDKRKQQLEEITQKLEQGIKELFDSERYKEYLNVMSKFHRYSYNNLVLIAMQNPKATRVAGFSSWKKDFERNVKKGEKGIKILAPAPYKIKKEVEKISPETGEVIFGKDGKPETEERVIEIPSYKVVTVFDVSQTEGKELPEIADNLYGDVENFKDFFSALEKTSPVPISFEPINNKVYGYYNPLEKRIVVKEGMDELHTLKTTIHEMAHAKLHDVDVNLSLQDKQDRPDKNTREVQAESVAYAVCRHYGLDTSYYSFGYVAGWSSGRELPELKTSLEIIRTAADEIIRGVDKYMKEIKMEQEALMQEKKQLTPDELMTGEKIQTPRGTFYVTDMTAEQMKIAGYGFHHQSDDGEYLIMGNGSYAFAIAADQRENSQRKLYEAPQKRKSKTR